MAVDTLRCRICECDYPAVASGVCLRCFGPLEPVYDWDQVAREATREAIESGPRSLWRYAALLPTAAPPDYAALLGALTMFLFPLSKIFTLGWLVLYARSGRRAPGFRPLMVAMHHLGPWTMSEVFVLGALVSIVKAHLYFDVLPDPGIYAYAGLMLLITLFAGVDLTRLWDETREESP